jgi:uncharacterized small protein (DUF1192 family)
MSFRKFLQRATHSLRERLSLPASGEVATLGKELAILRKEIARLRAAEASSAANGLNDRIGQLEILLTEHSKERIRADWPKLFPSPVQLAS